VTSDDDSFDRAPSTDPTRRAPFDVEAVRLLGSSPEGVEQLLGALCSPPEASELAGEHLALAAFDASLAASAHPHRVSFRRRHKMIAKVLSAKAAAAAVVAVALGSGVAAATGSLPTSLQMAAHRALGGVGIPAPANAHASTTARERAKARTAATASSTTSTTGSQMTTTGTSTTRSATTTTTLHGVGPLVPGPSLHGLCVAVEASGRGSGTLSANEPTAFGNLEAAANAKGESVSAYCASVLGTAPTSTSTTGSSTTNASGTTSTGTTSTSTGSPGRSGGAEDVQAHESGSASAEAHSGSSSVSVHAGLGASVSGQVSARSFGQSHDPLSVSAG